MGDTFQKAGDTKRWPTGAHRPSPSERRTEVVVKPRK